MGFCHFTVKYSKDSQEIFLLPLQKFLFPRQIFQLPRQNTLIFNKKEDRTQQIQVLSSSQYKYTTFFAEIQIPLTFRNTPTKVKMRRFAAASLWRVLYYEGHTWKTTFLGAKKRHGGLNTHRFRDRASKIIIWTVSGIA